MLRKKTLFLAGTMALLACPAIQKTYAESIGIQTNARISLVANNTGLLILKLTNKTGETSKFTKVTCAVNGNKASGLQVDTDDFGTNDTRQYTLTMVGDMKKGQSVTITVTVETVGKSGAQFWTTQLPGSVQ